MRVAIYGSRPDGHAAVVFDVLVPGSSFEVLGLIDDMPENVGRRVGPLAVIGTRDDLPGIGQRGVQGVILGFGSARGRLEVVEAVEAAGLELPLLVHDSAHIAPSASLGPGVQVLPNASVGPGARLARGSLVNTAAVVEHDVQLGECAVIGPAAVIAGRARVGPGAEIGAGAVVLPDVEVGENAVVGAGAVVIRPVAPGQTVAGVPARPLPTGP